MSIDLDENGNEPIRRRMWRVQFVGPESTRLEERLVEADGFTITNGGATGLWFDLFEREVATGATTNVLHVTLSGQFIQNMQPEMETKVEREIRPHTAINLDAIVFCEVIDEITDLDMDLVHDMLTPLVDEAREGEDDEGS